MRWAVLDASNIVRSIVDADDRPASAVATSDGDGCRLGWVWNGWSFEAPRWSTYDFLGRFTSDELSAIMTASQQDAQLRLFVLWCEAAHEVRADDQTTLQGMDYLIGIGLLTSTRRDEILGA